MKSKFFSFKLIITIFIILLGLSIAYLSSPPKHQVQEVHKEIQLQKK